MFIYGIRGPALQWFSSYLSNRQQYVVYNDGVSQKQQISCGVPQGSILGPLLFLIYINDLATVSKLFLVLLFADDTSLFAKSKDLHTLVNNINVELKIIFEWLNSNMLSLNVDKSNFMVFKPKGKFADNICIYINNTKINEVSSSKFLGVIIDNKLNWSQHINYIKNKIAKSVGIIVKARKVFDQPTLLSLYNSLIYPYISYCIHVWGNAPNCYISGLIVLQKKAVRIVSGVPPRTHTKPLFEDMNILTISQIFNYSLGMFMYKVVNHMMPPLFNHLFISTSNVHEHHTRQSDRLYVPLCPTTRSQRGIRYQGTSIWNLLSRKFDVSCKISTFKKYLKKFILSQ